MNKKNFQKPITKQEKYGEYNVEYADQRITDYVNDHKIPKHLKEGEY